MTIALLVGMRLCLENLTAQVIVELGWWGRTPVSWRVRGPGSLWEGHPPFLGVRWGKTTPPQSPPVFPLGLSGGCVGLNLAQHVCP